MPTVFGVDVAREIGSHADLREIAKPPSRFVANKVIDHIDDLSAQVIARASLVFLATQRSDGVLDVTPRGDPEGFVHVLSPKLIALPDRLGNMRMDSFENVIETGHVGLIFVVPGHNETLRVSGQAKLVEDPKLADKLSAHGKPSGLILLIQVMRVLSHCPKAFIRAKAWSPEAWPKNDDLPSAGAFLVAHGELPDPVSDVEAIVERDRHTRLY